MTVQLDEREARVLGCLLEKSVLTPDQYPLTLNALTNACNQKSSRNPVMNLAGEQVLGAIRSLREKHLVRVEENFRTQVDKYSHRLCNTPFSDYQFDPPQFAVITVLLLRGPRTPGELKSNSGRLHTFASNADVLATLHSLRDFPGGALVAELPRTPGRRDSEWMHLFSGAPDASSARRAEAEEWKQPSPAANRAAPDGSLEARVCALEEAVAELRRQLASRGD